MAAEERRKGIRTFADRVNVLVNRDREQRRREWIKSKEAK